MKIIGNIFFNFMMVLINIIDFSNKKKIIYFFKSKINNNQINVIDIGSHKGETIDLFTKNFNVNKIYSLEPNKNLFNHLISNKKYKLDKIELFNFGIGEKTENKELNVYKDTSSSTLNSLNEDTEYFKRKKKILSFFSLSENLEKIKQTVQIYNLSDFIHENNIQKIDILKIDTEGYEYKILKGIDSKEFKKVRYIYFEHHYDLMINKGYTYSDINNLLINNNFKKKFKLRMKFRKSFEYIYENSK